MKNDWNTVAITFEQAILANYKPFSKVFGHNKNPLFCLYRVLPSHSGNIYGKGGDSVRIEANAEGLNVNIFDLGILKRKKYCSMIILLSIS